MLKIKIISCLVIAFIFVGCSNTENEKVRTRPQVNLANAKIIADTITYDVILRAIDTSEVWEAECLQYLNRESFINYLFEGIYSNQLIAIEFMGNKVLKADDVKEIEHSEGFSRNLVTKVQFKERWYVDSLGNFQKEIISYTLGIEVYSKQNSFLGHKALFVIKPNS